jgi:pimeloyl-ACP methyl ester carboxylesterase
LKNTFGRKIVTTAAAYHPFRSAEAKTAYLTYYDEAARDWPVASEDRTTDTSYGQTFVRISGPVDSPPLVLLPGAGSCSLMWMQNIEALSARHRTYAVDSLIHTGCVGRSVYTRPITGPEDAVTWLDELFDTLGLGDDINLMGGSYGGWLVSQYVLHAPDRLGKVVLVAPAGTVLPFRGAYLFRSMLINLSPRRSTYIRYFRWVFKDLARVNPKMIEALADDFLMSVQSFEPVNPKEMPLLTALSYEELKSIKVPTLFLVGENEVLYSAQKAVQRFNEVAPEILTEIIPNAGHDLLLVQTGMVNQKVTTFLAD